jgi:hypothetical protein
MVAVCWMFKTAVRKWQAEVILTPAEAGIVFFIKYI